VPAALRSCTWPMPRSCAIEVRFRARSHCQNGDRGHVIGAFGPWSVRAPFFGRLGFDGPCYIRPVAPFPDRANIMTRNQPLDPVSRATEILFGLIMVLTFTASLNVAEAGRSDVRLMLIAALGCNLAWGLIDAAMYLLSVRAEGAISHQALTRVRLASTSALARREIRSVLPAFMSNMFDEGDLERVRLQLVSEGAAEPSRLTLADWRAALAVFLLVFISTLPVALPFLLIDDPQRALWASHTIAIGSLFLAGYSLGQHWRRPLRVGLAMVVLGLLLVAIALILGG
jgi:hypothetical protein